MDIWEDIVIKRILEEIKKEAREKSASTSKDSNLTAPRFVFVCGKKLEDGAETIRSIIIDNLEKEKVSNDYGKESQSVLCVVSENLYVQDLAEDIFTFEKMLAEISHKIIIVAESPGTFCELGAFVMDSEFSKKTIVINEDIDEYKDSFITRGPIKLLENHDEGSVILHKGLARIKTNIEFQHRLKDIAREKLSIPPNLKSEEIELQSLIYELANIIELFAPLESPYEIEWLYKEIKGFKNYTIRNVEDHKIKNIKMVLNLMERMRLICRSNGYYYLNKRISCYNILLTISRKRFNEIRIAYLNRLEKCQPQRMEG